MASINDQEKLLNSLVHQNDLEISDEMLEYLRNPTTPESTKLDALIDIVYNMNDRLDKQHDDQVQHQQKVEVWHDEDKKSGKFANRVGIATLIATVLGIFVGAFVTIGTQFLIS